MGVSHWSTLVDNVSMIYTAVVFTSIHCFILTIPCFSNDLHCTRFHFNSLFYFNDTLVFEWSTLHPFCIGDIFWMQCVCVCDCCFEMYRFRNRPSTFICFPPFEIICFWTSVKDVEWILRTRRRCNRVICFLSWLRSASEHLVNWPSPSCLGETSISRHHIGFN